MTTYLFRMPLRIRN